LTTTAIIGAYDTVAPKRRQPLILPLEFTNFVSSFANAATNSDGLSRWETPPE